MNKKSEANSDLDKLIDSINPKESGIIGYFFGFVEGCSRPRALEVAIEEVMEKLSAPKEET